MKSTKPQLFAMTWNQLGRKIRHDLARELTVASCFAVILATFSYVFGDFLFSQLQQISKSIFAAGLGLAAAMIAVISGYLAGRKMDFYRRTPKSLGNFLRWIGSPPDDIYFARALHDAIAVIISGTPLLLFIFKSPIASGPSAIALVLYLAALGLGYSGILNFQQPNLEVKTILKGSQSPSAVLFRWRWNALVSRNRAARLSLVLAAVCLAGSGLMAWLNFPFFAIALITLLGGIQASMAIPALFKEDIVSSWLDRSIGISHQQICKVYDRIGLVLGGSYGTIAAALVGFSALNGESLWIALDSVKAGLIGFTCPYLVPGILMQVDGRRPLIQFLIITILGLFIGTAILAQPVAVIILPILKYYLDEAQHNRYYRS